MDRVDLIVDCDEPRCGRHAIARLTWTTLDGGNVTDYCWRDAARRHRELRAHPAAIRYQWELHPGPLADFLVRAGLFGRTMTDADVARGLPPVLRMRRG
jgi:hypothetical protein